MKLHYRLTALVTLITSMALAGCSSVHTLANKSELDVKTQMSKSIFLDPTLAPAKTVYIQYKNSSDKQDIELQDKIETALVHKGYALSSDATNADLWLHVNLLQFDKSDLRDNQNQISRASDGAFSGAAVGSTIGSGDGEVAMGIAGAAAGILIDTMVEDTYYTVITDIQISENQKPKNKHYSTRITSTANKANLDFEEAKPALVDGIVMSIASIL